MSRVSFVMSPFVSAFRRQTRQHTASQAYLGDEGSMVATSDSLARDARCPPGSAGATRLGVQSRPDRRRARGERHDLGVELHAVPAQPAPPQVERVEERRSSARFAVHSLPAASAREKLGTRTVRVIRPVGASTTTRKRSPATAAIALPATIAVGCSGRVMERPSSLFVRGLRRLSCLPAPMIQT